MKPNPLDMLVFLEVADARSFTGAAARMGRTTSAVSQAVSRLEQDLGCRLFYRTTRSLSLTDAGARALSHCRDIKRIYSAAKADLKETEGDPAGQLSVTAPHALCAPLVGPAMAGLLSEHPGLSGRLIADDSPVDLVEQQIDLAIRVGTPTRQSARIAKIGTLSEAIYASAGYIEDKGGPPSAFADLESWDHVANEWQGSPVTYAGPSQQVIRVTPRIRCNSVLDVFQFVKAGAGAALLPGTVADSDAGAEGVRRLFSISKTPIFAVHLFEGRAPSKVRKFIAVLKEKLRTYQDLAPAGRSDK